MAMTRNTNDTIIAGVCSGLARHMGLDPIVVRLCFVLAFILFGAGPLVYLLLWILMPEMN